MKIVYCWSVLTVFVLALCVASCCHCDKKKDTKTTGTCTGPNCPKPAPSITTLKQ